jgi:hypothetical protein
VLVGKGCSGTKKGKKNLALIMARKRKAHGEPKKGEASATPPPKPKASKKNKASPPHSQKHHGSIPYPASKVYRFIEPSPVLLVTTGSLAESTHNVMTIGFHMVMQHESPPLIGISLGPWDASFTAPKKMRECVLAVPSVEMAAVVVDVGNCSADD